MARMGRGAEGRMNAGAAHEPSVKAPMSQKMRQSKASAEPESVVGTHNLGAAMRQLCSEHPEKYDSMGPHQSGSSHITHMPLHGLKPSGKA